MEKSFSTSGSGEEILSAKKQKQKKQTLQPDVTVKASLSMEYGVIMLHYNGPEDLPNVSLCKHISFPLMGFSVTHHSL